VTEAAADNPTTAATGHPVRAESRPGYDWLDVAAFAYLALPVVLFLLGWLRWWVGVPLTGLLLLGARDLMPTAVGASGPWAVRWGVAVLVLAVAAGWSSLGGAGHLFFANFDWQTRDLVLRDLVLGAWPVGYGLREGAELVLRAPIGFFLPAAAAGKMFGLQFADPALLVWTALGVALFLGLAASRVRGWPAVLLLVTVLVLFSGMDIVGTTLRGGLQLAQHLRPTDHIEWWADRFQFSSHTTQLFWVPNHALAGWIATALLVRHADRPEFARLLPLIVALIPIWSPLTAIGFVVLAGAWWVQQMIRMRAWRLVDPVNMLAALCIASVTGAYLVLGAGDIRSGVTAQADESMLFFVPHYLQFVLLEAGILWLLLLAVRADLLLIVAGLTLWLLPLVAFGPSNDLAMRASIPALVILALAAASVLSSPTRALQRRVYWPILLVLMLGVPTAVMEMTRAVQEPAWKPDYSKSLVPELAAEYPAHYATRLTGSFVDRLLRPVGNVNSAEPAGPVVLEEQSK
jgi:hypothetical protein